LIFGYWIVAIEHYYIGDWIWVLEIGYWILYIVYYMVGIGDCVLYIGYLKK